MKKFLVFSGRHPEPRPAVLGYGLAVLLVILATVVRWLLDPYMGDTVPYVTYFLANAIVIRFTGVGPSVLAIVLSTLAADWFFLLPHYTLWSSPAQLVTSGIFCAANLVILALAQAMRRAKGQAEANAQTALRRQAELQTANTQLQEEIAERHLAQQALETARAEAVNEKNRLKVIMETLPVGVAFVDTEGGIVQANSMYKLIWGGPRPAVHSISDYAAFKAWWVETGQPVQPEEWASARAVRQGETVLDQELQIQRFDGSRVFVLNSAAPILDAYGNSAGSVVALLDITKRVTAEQGLRESEARMKRAEQIAHLGSWELDLAANRLTWSDEVYRIFGLQPQEFGASYEAFLEAVHPEDRAAVDAAYSGSLREGRDTYEIEHRVIRKASGEIRTVQERCQHIRDGAGQIVRSMGMVHDITERKRAEAALRESEARFRFLAESIPHLVWSATPDGALDYFNQRSLDYAGESPSELQGWSWTSSVHPEDAERTIAAWKEAIAQGTEYRIEYRLRRGADGQYRWHLGHALPWRDAQGRIVRWFGTCTDMHEARLAHEQIQAMNTQLEQRVQERTAKLHELVGELEHFSYTITHDMRAPLRAMIGFGQLMLEEGCAACGQPVSKNFLRRITTAANRMDQLITDALNYSKVVRTELTLEPVEVGPLLRGMLDTYPNLQPPNAEIALEGEFPAVLGNAAALTQCFSNLLGNAVKFVAPGTVPQVRVWAEEVRSAECGVRHGRVRIWFEDNGIGIPKESQPRIFEMFQQLDKKYEGTGIGLALVRKNAERMGGKVGVESEPGRGSRFWLELQIS